ncbi:MAG: Lhr family helicase, partial [Vicinamibacterales bacterium]
NEDFAIESTAGDVFQLGNSAWRVLQVAGGTVRVADAAGAPPNIPFWLGEAPARSDELSRAVSDLRADIETTLRGSTAADAAAHLARETGLTNDAAEQAVAYLAEGLRALGVVPTQQTLVLERFFDEAGGMQLVLHAPFGSRINKAWGLALRKRFCRQFNFELQAAATDDALLLSLGPQHSFPLADVFRYLHPETTRDVLVQAFLDAPVFPTRWRWNTTIALAVPRSRGGKKVAPQIQRMLADDLMAAVFPDAAACLENIPGDRQIPDHPLVKQTVRDCLQEAMDFDGLRAVLERIHRGELQLVARDTPEPSLFAHDILNAKPYAFLDDAPLEERRAHAVLARRAGDPSRAGDLGALDATAIERVRQEIQPDPRDADELHDWLMTAGFLDESDVARLEEGAVRTLGDARRAATVTPAGGTRLLVAAERLPEIRAIHPSAIVDGDIEPPPSRAARAWTREEAIAEILRGRLTLTGPAAAASLARSLHVAERDIDAALLALESQGVILRGFFTPGGAHRELEWCDRSLLARIHRYTLNRLRAEIEPVSPADFMRFLFRWQHVEPSSRLKGIDGLREALAALDGFELAAGAWERAVLPARVADYEPSMLDMLCLAGEMAWGRLSSVAADSARSLQLGSATPVALFLREHDETWRALHTRDESLEPALHPNARALLDLLHARGASFLADLSGACGLDRYALHHAMGTLVACGLARSDGFSGLRQLLSTTQGRFVERDRRARFAGRWTATRRVDARESYESSVDTHASALLRRYGVVFRRIVTRETALVPWRDLVRVYRRLEARGEIRGGRFVSGMSGEQFALPEAVQRLREVRRGSHDERLITISTADPLNLTGIVAGTERIRAAGRNRLVYRHGTPVAVMEADFVRELVPLDRDAAAEVAQALGRRRVPSLLAT